MIARSQMRLALAVLAFSATATDAGAQDDSAVRLARANLALTNARALQMSGNYARAREVLLDAASQCGAAASARACRGKVQFGLGYIAQLQGSTAAGTDSSDAAVLADAVRGYRAVLIDYPMHADALKNVWLVYAGANPRLLDTAQIAAAAAADPARAADYATLAGNHFVAIRNLESARAAYRRAMTDRPSDPTPRSRLLDTYDVARAADADALISLGQSWEATFPELALDAYRRVVAGVTSEPVQQRVLPRWLSLAVRQDVSVDSAIGALTPPVSATKPIVDLRSYAAQPWRAPSGDNWWLEKPDRTSAFLELSEKLGDRMLAGNDVAHAEECWTIALGFLNRAEMYGYAPGLDVQRALVTLYDGHPNLDPGGAKFRAVENRLFEAKAVMITMHDSVAEQRYHVTLGIIYAGEGRWKGDRYAHDALYQLEAAERLAAARDRGAGTYQPLALVHALLARGYVAVGRAADAQRETLAAARAYLDVDDLKTADSLLAKPATGTTPDARAAAAMRAVIQLRREQSKVLGRGPALTPRAECGTVIERTLVPLASDTAFVARQRFKMLADCAGVSPDSTKIRLSAAALSLAATNHLSLSGPGDLVRLDNTRSTVMGHLGLTAETSKPVAGAIRRAPADVSTYRVAVGTGDEPTYIQLPSHEQKAAVIAGELADVKPGLRLRFDGANVSILATPAGVSAARMTAAIGKLDVHQQVVR